MNNEKLYQHGVRISFSGRMPFYYFILFVLAVLLFFFGGIAAIEKGSLFSIGMGVFGIYLSCLFLAILISPFLANDVYMYAKSNIVSLKECKIKIGKPTLKNIYVKEFSEISFNYRTQGTLTFEGKRIDGGKLQFCVSSGVLGLFDFLKISKFFKFIVDCKEINPIDNVKHELFTSKRGKFCKVISGNYEIKKNVDKPYLFYLTIADAQGHSKTIKNVIALPDIVDHVETAKTLCIGSNNFGSWAIYGVISGSGDIIVDLSDFTLSKSTKRQILYGMMDYPDFISALLPVVGVFYNVYCIARYSIKQADYFIIYDLLYNFQEMKVFCTPNN
ncbi:hypothetical protein LDB30_06355 [Acidithiobacillus ferrooxidans]|nr:hypothetical protein LDB30_06355 [Acidithiobacillus ferrooxidans]